MKALRPIRSERDYEHALLDILATRIEAYETEHYPMHPPDSIEAIRFRVEQQGLTRKSLAEMLGTRTRA